MKPSRPLGALRGQLARQRGDDLGRQPRGVDERVLGPARVRVDAGDRQHDLLGGERLVLQLAEVGAVERVGADGAEGLDVEQRRALADLLVGREADPQRAAAAAPGCAARWATAAMISATPALSSAPSSVSPLELTMSWPTAFASVGISAGSSTVPPRGSSIASRRRRGARSARRPHPARPGSCRRARSGRRRRPRRAASRSRSRCRPAPRPRARSPAAPRRAAAPDRAGPACSGSACDRARTACRCGRSAGTAPARPGRASRPRWR